MGDDSGPEQPATDPATTTQNAPAVETRTPEPTAPDPALPVAAAPAIALDDPARISASRILEDRPDVLRAYYKEFYEHDSGHAPGWAAKIGGVTPEAFATYWYAHDGKYEGYAQGATTAQDNVSLEKILTDRPDVLRAFYKEFYGVNEGRHSGGWVDRVGGDTPEAYAKHWYENHGKWEGYAQSEKAAAENIDVERLLTERPDVMRAFYSEFYGPNNDRHSSAWVDRVGGDTVQDYGKYWYKTYGKAEGYNQAPHGAATPANPGGGKPAPGPEPSAPSTDIAPPVADPSLDPWNHPAIYPDWKPPYEGWTPADAEIIAVGKALLDPVVFG